MTRPFLRPARCSAVPRLAAEARRTRTARRIASALPVWASCTRHSSLSKRAKSYVTCALLPAVPSTDYAQNRLLSMIRQQQTQIDTLQANQPHASSSAVDDSTPTSERSMSLPRGQPIASPIPSSQPRSRSPFNISRQSSFADRSRGPSHTGSPSLRPFPGQPGTHDVHDMLPGPATGRDESAFYQAETQNLTRENQMLKLRIRELGEFLPSIILRVFTNALPERQLSEMNPTNQVTHSPVIHSSLSPVATRGSTEQTSEAQQSS
jgi:hypothetical protein